MIFQVPLTPNQFTNSSVTSTKTHNQSSPNPMTPHTCKRKSRLSENLAQSSKSMTLNKIDTVEVVTLALNKLSFLDCLQSQQVI